jgi:hypothetical protein
MDIVMFHSGKSLPVFLKDTFSQLRLFNPTTTVYFITDREHLADPVFTLNSINVVDKQKYISDDIQTFCVLYGRGKDNFWTITTTRLMYIANFIKEQNLHDVYHLENDVLLYTDISEFNFQFTKLYTDLAITVGGPDKCMTGFLFIKRPQALQHMVGFFIKLLKSSTIHIIRKQYGMDMVNEMTLMRVYSREYPNLLKFLPILPFGDFAENYNMFNSIFDPASWGQYVGGTLDGVPGAKPDDHYIGLLLREHLEYTVIWKQEEKGRVPYFKFDGQEVRINNLHIHSKNLHLYLS